MPGTPDHLPCNTPQATGCGWPQVETDPATLGAGLCSQERNACILEDDRPSLSPTGLLALVPMCAALGGNAH